MCCNIFRCRYGCLEKISSRHWRSKRSIGCIIICALIECFCTVNDRAIQSIIACNVINLSIDVCKNAGVSGFVTAPSESIVMELATLLLSMPISAQVPSPLRYLLLVMPEASIKFTSTFVVAKVTSSKLFCDVCLCFYQAVRQHVIW